MAVFTLELPAMYGDHHVVEVKRILLGLEGVDEVYASSGFRAAEITYNSKQIKKAEVISKLEEAGYLGELPIPAETDVPANEANGDGSFFRHTEAYAQTNHVVSFGQKIGHGGRALWPCPGMEPIRGMDEE
jgi:copper chaperone CopZ